MASFQDAIAQLSLLGFGVRDEKQSLYPGTSHPDVTVVDQLSTGTTGIMTAALVPGSLFVVIS